MGVTDANGNVSATLTGDSAGPAVVGAPVPETEGFVFALFTVEKLP